MINRIILSTDSGVLGYENGPWSLKIPTSGAQLSQLQLFRSKEMGLEIAEARAVASIVRLEKTRRPMSQRGREDLQAKLSYKQKYLQNLDKMIALS